MSYDAPPPPYPGAYPPPSPYGAGPLTHPQGTLILVFGILGLVCCGPLGIASWIMGNNAIKQIDASGMPYSNRGQINAGRILGMIATAWMVVGVILYITVLSKR